MSTINWVVAGVGDIARRRVIPAIQAERRSTLYGLVTRNAAKAEDYPGVKTWPTVEDAIQDSAVGALYIALPVVMHADAAIAALRAGKHVLCEKPMAMNHTEAGRIVAEAQASGRVFGVSYYRRLYPKLIRARQLIAEGAIGQPVLVEANCHSWLPSEDRAWLCDPAMAGGGPIYDIASHRIDAMNFLFGKPEQAIGLLSNAVHPIKVEDSASLLIRYSGGIHGYVDVRWNSRISRDQFRIVGVEGEINLDSLNGPELRVAGRVEMLPPHANLHYPLVLNFAGAVAANSPGAVICTGEQAQWVDWVIEQVMHCPATRP
ncbi:MAG TPA: Gfo/Idh/MocA family oxidoreductase [Terracidiphilus sp.]|nr:Gfo/Idh/MocA family oxidoreductase [Terracidiphilus sp.]